MKQKKFNPKWKCPILPVPMNDEFIISFFFKNSHLIYKRLTSSFLERPELKPIIEYLETRYKDSTGIRETLWRIKEKIEIRPVCKVCGKPVVFACQNGVIFQQTCSPQCSGKDKDRQEKIKNTCLKKYGTTCTFKSEEIKEKIKNTCMELYGVPNGGGTAQAIEKAKRTTKERYGEEYYTRTKEYKERAREVNQRKYGKDYYTQTEEYKERAKATCLEKYGTEYSVQAESVKEKSKESCLKKYGTEYATQSEIVKEKSRQTCLERYGVSNGGSSEQAKQKAKGTCQEKYNVNYYTQTEEYKQKYKQTCLEKYGSTNYFSSEVFYEKVIKAKKSMSRFEQKIFDYLKEIFDESDIISQYKDERYKNQKSNYKWNCDFYVKSLDLFIEVQGTKEHNNHPFNPNNKNDLEELELLKQKEQEKLKEKNHTRYTYIIEGWTVIDPMKRQVAQENHLKYLELFDSKISFEEFKNLISNIDRKYNLDKNESFN